MEKIGGRKGGREDRGEKEDDEGGGDEEGEEEEKEHQEEEESLRGVAAPSARVEKILPLVDNLALLQLEERV